MTIALGILADDGVVVGSDTQETYSGLVKLDHTKILGADRQENGDWIGAMAVTGAGSSGYLDAIAQELCDLFHQTKPRTTVDIERHLKAHVKQFVRDHVAPFGRWPDHDRPEMSLIVGTLMSGSPHMFATEKSTFRHVGWYEAVGIGAAQANLLLSRFRQPKTVTAAGALAAYVLYYVKQCVDGCGKQSQIAMLSENRVFTYWPEVVEALERQFERVMAMEGRLVGYLLGLEEPTGKRGDRVTLTRQLKELRKAIEAAEECASETWDEEQERKAITGWERKPEDGLLPTMRRGCCPLPGRRRCGRVRQCSGGS